MDKRVLVTAIGSMSAECVIKQLKLDGYFVVGCDIYPGEWHCETKLCDVFVRAPFATKQDEYITFLISTCKKYNLQYIIPLTDLEIDVINRQRKIFDDIGIILCTQAGNVLNIARNKYELSKLCKDDACIPSVETYKILDIPENFKFPCIAKPYNGRSSEGLLRNATRQQIEALEDKESYIVQKQLIGSVYTVDYCRNAKFGTNVAIPRRELLRTKNGAGLTVQIVADAELIKLVYHIGEKLNINGCVNMEFIFNEGRYYLIDINPRFSAGIAFSVVSGYNMVLNHMRCFCDENIDKPIQLEEKIIIKKYTEVIA